MKDLDLISPDFPTSRVTTNATTTLTLGLATCGCCLRKDPPNHPTSIPFEPTHENRGKLEKWILEHYASSAFNVCPHQPLQTMTRQPLHITFKPGATPFATHYPIPVPHHWKKAVKADLDCDIALGIIEPMPQRTPTVWCTRMVIAPKQDGSPEVHSGPSTTK